MEDDKLRPEIEKKRAPGTIMEIVVMAIGAGACVLMGGAIGYDVGYDKGFKRGAALITPTITPTPCVIDNPTCLKGYVSRAEVDRASIEVMKKTWRNAVRECVSVTGQNLVLRLYGKTHVWGGFQRVGSDARGFQSDDGSSLANKLGKKDMTCRIWTLRD